MGLRWATEQTARLFSTTPVPGSAAPLIIKLFVVPGHFLSGPPWSLTSYKNAPTWPEPPAGLELNTHVAPESTFIFKEVELISKKYTGHRDHLKCIAL